ncbi:alpha-2-macroglobulin family protein [Calothrix sp. 336/3]|uniref:alpha-2-macroglobulin family protein n=1 Tax=Calothrix sp. 336/3 TaxID=1337936 RepID=UPI0004E3BECE|nr:alpha-2-macroglobulin [Calothrix sp. 336/3]AKG20177.1 hypothetical protein IJ00_01620 [Calothrix sp. 336/3]
MKTLVRILLIFTLFLGLAGCNLIGISSQQEQLATVAALPTPQLPAWIEQISPLGEATPLQQIRIRFREPLIPIESLDNPQQQNLLTKFVLEPPIKGQFRFLTPRMVGFQAEKALPKATRLKVTLKSGLADLKNHRLNQDLAWTFNTESIKISNLPGKNPVEDAENEPIDLKQKLQATANTELDISSLQQHLQLIPEGKKEGIKFNIELDKSDNSQDSTDPLEKFDPSQRNWIYNLTPQKDLEKSAKYRLVFAPGILPSYGNLPSDKEFSSKINTYSPLAFKQIKFYGLPDGAGAYGRFVNGSPQLEFNNGLVAESAIKSITINPKPQDISRLIQANDNEAIISLNPYGLEPNKTYTITIDGNLQDKFGQTLGKPVTVKYSTGDVAGDMWVPNGLNIFPSGKDLQLNISAVNLPEKKYQAAFKVVEPRDLVYSNSASPLLPQQSQWQSFPIPTKKNQLQQIAVSLKDKLPNSTGMLAYGVQAKINKYQEEGKELWREPTTYGLVQLTNLGVFSQWFPDSGLIRVHHLNDGSPVNGANVEIYQSKLEEKSTTTPLPCTSGKTDTNGLLQLKNSDLQGCFPNQASFSKSPQLLVIAKENQDWAFARTEEYSGSYGYGIYADWDEGKPLSRGVIFSDRQLYQPGEKAWFTAIATFFQNRTIQQDMNGEYQVNLVDANGKKTNLGKKTTNEFGTFSLELPIQKNQPLGYYTIQATGKNGREISGEFRIAEFKPPNFKVDLKLNQEFAYLDEKITAQTASNYLFGAPVSGGQAKYFVTREKVNFTPKNWEEFTFGRQWFYPEEAPNITSDVLQTTTQLDNTGNSNQIITVAKDLPYPMEYRVDVQVADVSNLSVASSQKFTALPSKNLIGLKNNFVADGGKEFPVEIIVTDAAGKPQENQRVRLELQEMKYSNVTQVLEGTRTQKNQIEYQTVATTEVNSKNSPQTVKFTPKTSGSYRIRANFSNTKDEITATDTQIWVTGDNSVNWTSDDKNLLEVKLNKKEYQPGETATALIQSPYPEGELYFAVIKDKPLYQKVTKVKGGAPQIQFQITPEMLPNAAVQAVLVRQGVPLKQVEPGTVDKLVKIGFAPFKVNLQEKYLNTKITPLQPSLEPGGEETIQLELTDKQNQPTKGQLTVMVVNEAVLQLSGYRPPDLVNTVYAEQPLSTRFADNRPDVVVEQSAIAKPKGWGYGGGLSDAAASTRIRKEFQALAYYNGSLVTDDTGKAQVTFKLPDDLTTWRVMVVATDGNLRFGNGDASFLTTKPVLTNAILPQFARPGDRFQGGLSVTNNSGKSGSLSLNGEFTGTVKFAEKNSLTTNLETATRAYRFPMVADKVGTSELKFTTQVDGTSVDAFAVPLEVKPLAVTEAVVETGVTTKTTKIPLNIQKEKVSDDGLEIQIASTLIPEITAPAKEVWEEELPFAEPATSQLKIAASLQTIATTYKQNFAEFQPENKAKQALEKLQQLQLTDGGFASYPGQEKSDPWVSADIAEALSQTNQAFPQLVKQPTISRLQGYLNNVAANPGKFVNCKESGCKSQLQLNALIGLEKLGEKRNSFLADIYKQKDTFSIVNQIKLARYLTLFPEWQDEAKALTNKLQQNISETGRSASINLPSNWRWMNSQTAAQSQALRLFISQKSKPETLDKILQSLLNLRRDGTWQSSYDNAEALTSLADYAQLEATPPNFLATVKLAGKKLLENKFVGYTNPSAATKVSLEQIPQGKHDLVMEKSGQGKLHYLVAYRYRLPGNQPGRYQGLRVSRQIREVNGEKPLQEMGLYATDKPTRLNVGQVFDIALELITDHPVDHVLITDPLAAGLEAIDQSFQTSTSALQSPTDSWELGYRNIYRDRLVAYANHLEPGVYSLHYLVRSVTPGTFTHPGAEAHLKYAPEEFGRSAESTLVVEEKS